MHPKTDQDSHWAVINETRLKLALSNALDGRCFEISDAAAHHPHRVLFDPAHTVNNELEEDHTVEPRLL